MKSLYFLSAVLLSIAFLALAQAQDAQQSLPPNYKPPVAAITTSAEGSTYVPMDSWMYPALDRLHALGYLDNAFLGIRPWTRLAIMHMLQESADRIDSRSNNEEARRIYLALRRELQPDVDNASEILHPTGELDQVYEQVRGVSGMPLRDSFHFGQTIVDDYGRPYENGFNNYAGFAARAEAGRFTFYYRGEFQYAPSATGYSTALAQFLSKNIDDIDFAANPHQATIPEGSIPAATFGRVMEATASFHLLGHEVSFGKSDHWMGPDQGAAMLWSSNEEDIYQFQIDRVEPLHVPLLSRITGPFRYDFFVGSLKGHTDPNDPWVHIEKINFKPTKNLEFGFDRMVIWGGKGHAPITVHTFLHSFFSFSNVTVSQKNSRSDPGARFASFDFSYRLPYLRHWVTLYTDSFVHDDQSPIAAPRRAAVHPGIYLAQFPHLHQLDLRVEGGNTEPTSHYNPDGTPINQGRFLYWEGIQKQGPTNKGFLPDWIGREGEGGQAWLTYHLSPDEDVQVAYRRAKAAKVFIPGGTTQNDFEAEVRKRIGRNFEALGRVQYESWKAPFYQTTPQSDTTAAIRFTWYPPGRGQ